MQLGVGLQGRVCGGVGTPEDASAEIWREELRGWLDGNTYRKWQQRFLGLASLSLSLSLGAGVKGEELEYDYATPIDSLAQMSPSMACPSNYQELDSVQFLSLHRP